MHASKVKSSLSIAIAATLLTGCATDRSSGSCPPLVSYSKSFLAKAANEFDRLPSDSGVAAMIVDYSKLRDACRVK